MKFKIRDYAVKLVVLLIFISGCTSISYRSYEGNNIAMGNRIQTIPFLCIKSIDSSEVKVAREPILKILGDVLTEEGAVGSMYCSEEDLKTAKIVVVRIWKQRYLEEYEEGKILYNIPAALSLGTIPIYGEEQHRLMIADAITNEVYIDRSYKFYSASSWLFTPLRPIVKKITKENTSIYTGDFIWDLGKSSGAHPVVPIFPK